MKNEIWRDIECFKGYCQVSSYGRVRELDNGSWSLLDPELNSKYGSKPLIKLSGRYKLVEYLVCREFICKEVEVSFTRSTIKDDGVKVYILMHKDGSYLNNHVDNLYWKCLGDSGSKEVAQYLWDETKRDKNGYRKNMLLCIETGIGYDVPEFILSRPFISNTRDALSNSRIILNAMKRGLSRQGLEVI